MRGCAEQSYLGLGYQSPCFISRQTFHCKQGRSVEIFFFFFSCGKSHLKNAKVTLKTQKCKKTNKQTFFTENVMENILIDFQKFSAKILRFLVNKQLILQDFGKIKKGKTPPKIENLSWSHTFFSWPCGKICDFGHIFEDCLKKLEHYDYFKDGHIYVVKTYIIKQHRHCMKRGLFGEVFLLDRYTCGNHFSNSKMFFSFVSSLLSTFFLFFHLFFSG